MRARFWTPFLLSVIVSLAMAAGLVPAGAQVGGAGADTIRVVPAAFGLEGDDQGRLLDPDARFDPGALLELSQAGDEAEAALRRLLIVDPSPYAATRGLILGLLGEASAPFAASYAFEDGRPDGHLSGPEITALINGPLAPEEVVRLATSARVLSDPGLVGAGEAAFSHQLAFIQLNNELAAHGLGVRDRQRLSKALRGLTAIAPERKAQLLDPLLAARLTVGEASRQGLSQLLTAIGRDPKVPPQDKLRLLSEELGVSVSVSVSVSVTVEGAAAAGPPFAFSSAQLGAMYVVLKAVPPSLRQTLRRIVPLEALRPRSRTDPDTAGLYVARRIGLRSSLGAQATAGVLEHELGHLAWEVALTGAQRRAFQQLHRQSRAQGKGFVSSYARTNELEDYAETFQAYLADSVRLLERAQGDPLLREKLRLVASVLQPYIYRTASDLLAPEVRRAEVPFIEGYPQLPDQIAWQAL